MSHQSDTCEDKRYISFYKVGMFLPGYKSIKWSPRIREEPRLMKLKRCRKRAHCTSLMWAQMIQRDCTYSARYSVWRLQAHTLCVQPGAVYFRWRTYSSADGMHVTPYSSSSKSQRSHWLGWISDKPMDRKVRLLSCRSHSTKDLIFLKLMNWFSLWEDAKLGVVFCLSTLCMWSFSCTTQNTPHFWWYNTSTFPPLLPIRGVLAVAHWEESTGWNVLQLAVAGMSSEFISSLSLIRPLNTSRGFRTNFLTSAGLSCTVFLNCYF